MSEGTRVTSVNFFRGVLPDLEEINLKRQRIFKAELVKLVNKLVDREEEENTQVSSRPIVYIQCNGIFPYESYHYYSWI